MTAAKWPSESVKIGASGEYVNSYRPKSETCQNNTDSPKVVANYEAGERKPAR